MEKAADLRANGVQTAQSKYGSVVKARRRRRKANIFLENDIPRRGFLLCSCPQIASSCPLSSNSFLLFSCPQIAALNLSTRSRLESCAVRRRTMFQILGILRRELSVENRSKNQPFRTGPSNSLLDVYMYINATIIHYITK